MSLCWMPLRTLTKSIVHRCCCYFSEFVTVSNGAKRAGILSPHLFNDYMDDLSVNLNKLNYAGIIMNHMMYADNLCVFSPSVSGLRKLTVCCAEYGNMFDITYNANKSICRVIVIIY